MKKWDTQTQCFRIFCLALLLLSYKTALAVSPVDSLSLIKSKQANYIIPRYVIGSGGVIGVRSPNYVHHGTAGQSIVGGALSVNNILLSGFWIQPAGPTKVSPAEKSSLPTVFALHQNYPNPFNPETTIAYDLPNACVVTVEIFNTVGQRIRLVSSHLQGPGRATVMWDGRDDLGQAMVSGVYFYKVTALALKNSENNQQIQFQQTKKMILVK